MGDVTFTVSQSTVTFIVIIMILVIVVLTAVMFSTAKNKLNTPSSVNAQLISKTDERKRTEKADGSVKIQNDKYELVFRTKNNDEKVFAVSRQVFKNIPVGEKGNLIYHKNQFLKFRFSGGTVEEVRKEN